MINTIQRAKKKGFSVIVYSHAARGTSLLRKSIVLFVARLYGAKTIIQLHAIETENYIKNPLKIWLFRAAILPAHQMCVLTTWWQKKCIEAGIKKRITVIPNALSEDLEQQAKGGTSRASLIHKGITTILTMTRIERGKGVETVVEAMRFLPQHIQLIVAGDGSRLSYVKKKAYDLDLTDRIQFVGWVSGEQKEQILNRSDIFCLPTLYDSFGIVFLEAMAHGIPVIAVDYGPIRDVIADNYTGILIHCPEPKLCADAIQTVMNEQVFEYMKKNSQQWVLEQFSAERVGSKFQKLINQL